MAFLRFEHGFRRALLSLTALAPAVTGCAMVGPDFSTPPTVTAPAWIDARDKRVKEGAPAPAEWWRGFGDETLNGLIDQAYRNNVSLQSAGVAVLQARAVVGEAVGSLYPQTQTLQGQATWQQQGATSSAKSPSQTGQATFPRSGTFGFNVGWEIDFWGKFQRGIEAADASLAATMAAYDAALVTLTADVATTYISIRNAQELERTIRRNIGVQRESLKIARSRFDNGETSELDVSQAQSQLFQTEAQLPSTLNTLRQQQNALAVLLGTTPDKVGALLGDSAKARIPTPPGSLAVGIPADLLRRRPDVRQAELTAAAQSAQIGVSEADLYPAFSLTGFLGLISSSAVTGGGIIPAFQARNISYSMAPAVSLPIFNYGQLSNRVRAQDATFQQAVLSYQNTVLTAQKEVENGLSAYLRGQEQVASLSRALASARRTYEISMDRYRQGQTDFTTVLTSEQGVLQVEESLDNARGSLALGMVSVYRAFGGGWEIRKTNDVVSDPIKTEMGKRTKWGNLLDPTTRPPAEEKKPLLRAPDW